MTDREQQDEEREALEAIYGEEAVQWSPSLRVLTLTIGGGDGGIDEDGQALLDEFGVGNDAAAAAAAAAVLLKLRALLPDDYPSRSPPVVEVETKLSDNDGDGAPPPLAACA